MMKKLLENKKILKVLLLILGLIVASGFFLWRRLSVAYTPEIVDDAGKVIPGSITTIETVNLGGIDQTITIRGVDQTKPVLLYLHGGPGLPSSPWASWNNTFDELEKNFVLVHWDQRGAGKSFHKELTPKDMTIEKLVSDTLELTDILRQRFNQDKIFLWGHSWGSGLGFETLRASSEPYYAFIASATRPNWQRGQTLSYEKTLEFVKQKGDQEAIKELESIKPFDPQNREHFELKNKYLEKYLLGDFHIEGAGEEFMNYGKFGRGPEYPLIYVKSVLDGLSLSRQTIAKEIIESNYDHAKDFPESPIPVFFFQGKYDYNCPVELAEEYFNILQAPLKKLIIFENSAHNIDHDESVRLGQEMKKAAEETMEFYQR